MHLVKNVFHLLSVLFRNIFLNKLGPSSIASLANFACFSLSPQIRTPDILRFNTPPPPPPPPPPPKQNHFSFNLPQPLEKPTHSYIDSSPLRPTLRSVTPVFQSLPKKEQIVNPHGTVFGGALPNFT